MVVIARAHVGAAENLLRSVCRLGDQEAICEPAVFQDWSTVATIGGEGGINTAEPSRDHAIHT